MIGVEKIQEEVATGTETEVPVTETAENLEESKEKTEGSEDEPKEEPFPKKAVNALKYQKKRNEKLTSKLRDLESRFKEMEAKYASSALKAPDAKEYDNYADYLKGDVEYQIDKRMQDAEQKKQADAFEQQKQQILAQREDEVVSRISEVGAIIPDLQATLSQAGEYVQSVPAEIERMFYDLDAPEMALYALQKEGRVAEVVSMTPALAAVHLIQAEQRGLAYLKHMQTSKVTKAPDPLRGAKGVGDIKSEATMSGADLLRKYKLK